MQAAAAAAVSTLYPPPNAMLLRRGDYPDGIPKSLGTN